MPKQARHCPDSRSESQTRHDRTIVPWTMWALTYLRRRVFRNMLTIQSYPSSPHQSLSHQRYRQRPVSLLAHLHALLLVLSCAIPRTTTLHPTHAPMDHFLTLDQFDLCADLASEALCFDPAVHRGDTSPTRPRADEAFIPLVNEDHSDGRYDRSAVVGCIIA